MFTFKSGKIEAAAENKKKLIVSDISFSIEEGRSLALIGETGSGKTMIANAIMGLLPENVSAKGLSSSLRGILGRDIVYIPQSGLECLNQSRKIGAQLIDTINLINKQLTAAEKKSLAIEKLSLAGLANSEEIMEMYPFELSGGMGQRVVIAIAACSDAKLVIADEPTNGLDEESKFEFIDLMKEVFPSAAKLVITHDISVAKKCDDILVICKGKFMESGPSEKVLSDTKHPYTRALIDALVENGMKETFMLRRPQKLCPFYSRCKMADFECTVSIQTRVEDGRMWSCNH